MATSTLAVDFRTSNSAAAFLDGTPPRRIEIEPSGDLMDGGTMRIGSAATGALIGGE